MTDHRDRPQRDQAAQRHDWGNRPGRHREQ